MLFHHVLAILIPNVVFFPIEKKIYEIFINFFPVLAIMRKSVDREKSLVFQITNSL